MKKKVLFISEYLNPPYDEGIKKTVYNLFLDLDKNYDLKVICRHGFQKDNIHIVETNALYYSKEVKSSIKNFNPDSIIYIPFQSSTFATYLRLKMFSYLAKKAKVILIALQPKPLKSWQKFIVNFIKPKMAFTPSPALQNYWSSIKVKNQLIPLLTDLSIFRPLSENRETLRKKYNLPLEAFIISHMGHLNEGRNLKTLIPLQNEDNQVVIVSSSSTPTDALGKDSLKDYLVKSGIIILDRYIENIEEIYQLSDLYIFPVMKKNSSIGMPLSVLEARACGIPVLTTNYGSLSQFLGTDNDGIKYSNPEDFIENVRIIKNNLNPNYNVSKVSELNSTFYNIIHNEINL
ncbi:glycosyltransferase family 4 protein [Aureibaculum sp. 2210JD6-5]|uniref:glycosyltransferase family 4 protein n=1 Tax=Aureibaculum sp. 2210JD6-5 TaxID=3103957 RepID=UPI002AADE715|nr:glycosyltransferase family 4 protein [Aureibaculum sp. 2210JD6-5]MDY7394082.1 glycosyltransferase family 4 protein [Aureibaculum sp. 2210JD6-5]